VSLDGAWHNELGSTLTITTKDDGTLEGTYESRVGETTGSYPVTGRHHPRPGDGAGSAVGWVVSWTNSSTDCYSLTSWAGQYFAAEPERLSMTWLLVMEGAPGEAWESTLIGQDLFTRTVPHDAEVRRRLAYGTKSSHPLRRS